MHKASVLYDYAMKMVGLPYKWGGDDTIDGFDCSGLVIELLQSVDVIDHKLDTTAHGILKIMRERGCEKPTNTANFADLVFFGKTRATHVGFCLNDLQMLEAGGGGSKTKTRQDAADQNAIVRIRPISIRSDILSVCRPDYPWRHDYISG